MISVAGDGAKAVTGAITGGSTLLAKNANVYYRSGCTAVTGGEAFTPVDAANATEKTEEQFRLAEVAYLLDGGSDSIRTYIWTQGAGYPVFASADETAVYRVTVLAAQNGSIVPVGESYGAGGSTMEFAINPDKGYTLSKIILKDSDGNACAFSVSGSKVSFTMPASNATLSAEFREGSASADEYTVTFKSQDEVFSTAKVRSGNTVSAPAEKPAREGYVFKGWFTAAENGEKFDFGTLITTDVTLYAGWVAEESNTVKVSFNLNGPSTEAPASQEISVGSLVTKPADPTWESSEAGFRYTFAGWFTAKAGGNLWDFENDKPTEDITLYAHWTKTDAFAGGSETSPVIITTYEELKQLASNVTEGFGYGGSYFKLGADITIEDADWGGLGYLKVENKNQMPEIIASGTVPFNGTFDGDGHTITLNPDQTVPVFGAIGSVGVVKNLNVKGTLNADPNYNRKVFGAVAAAHFGLIENCNVELAAGPGSETKGNVAIYGGGVVGALANGIIRGCTAKVDIYCMYQNEDDTPATGGIVGYVVRGGIENCTVKAGSNVVKIATTAVVDYGVGGIAGAMTSDTTASGKYSYMSGCTVERGVTVRGTGNVGGLAGYSTFIENCRVGASIYGNNPYAFAGVPQTVGEHGITNSYYYGSFIQGTGDLLRGNLHNCYYAFVGDAPEAGSKTESSLATRLTEAQIASGEAAWLLDGGTGAHYGAWTQSDSENCPVQGKPSYYAVNVSSTGKGTATVNGETSGIYLPDGSNVALTITADKYEDNEEYGPQYDYALTSLKVNGVEVGDSGSFTINGANCDVQATFELKQIGYNQLPGTGGDVTPVKPTPDPEPSPEPSPEPKPEQSGDGSGTGTGEGGTGTKPGGDTGNTGDTGTTGGTTTPSAGGNTGTSQQQPGTNPPRQPQDEEQVELPPVEEPPVEEPPVEEPPIEEPPVEEKPADTPPEETAPVEEQPDDSSLITDEPQKEEETKSSVLPVVIIIAAVVVLALVLLLVLLKKKKQSKNKAYK